MLTQEQLARRHEFIGASEVAAIIGLDPFRTALDVYAQKVGLVPATPTNKYMRWGNRLEAVVADAYAEETGRAIVADQETRLHPVHAFIAATPDYRAEGNRLLEIKTGDSRTAERWGEPGTDEVPEHVACQVVQQMAVCDVDFCDVAVLLGGNDFRVYTIQRDREIEAALIERVVTFWQQHILTKCPPDVDDGEARQRFVARLFPRSVNELIRTATSDEADVIQALAAAKATLANVENDVAMLESELKSYIGEAAGLGSPFGTVTWKSTKSGGTDWKAIVEALNAPADLIAKYARPGSRRFLYTRPKLALKGAA